MFALKSLLKQTAGLFSNNKKDLYMKVDPTKFVSINLNKNSIKPISNYYDIVLKTNKLEVYNIIDKEKTINNTEIIEMTNEYIKVIYDKTEEYILFVFVKLKSPLVIGMGILISILGSSIILFNQNTLLMYLSRSFDNYLKLSYEMKMISF